MTWIVAPDHVRYAHLALAWQAGVITETEANEQSAQHRLYLRAKRAHFKPTMTTREALFGLKLP